jgi:hypothetical protein
MAVAIHVDHRQFSGFARRCAKPACRRQSSTRPTGCCCISTCCRTSMQREPS